MREIRFFQPQATRKRMVKQIRRFDDEYDDLQDVSKTTIPKKSMILHSDMYLTRYSSKYKESHKHLYRLKQLLFGRWTIHHLQISYYQMIVIVMTLQVTVQKILRLHKLYLLSYRRCGFLTHMMTAFLMGAPLFAYFMFMGYYSKKCFIRYWQSTPILKGIAFALIITLIFESSNDVLTCSMAMLYISTIIENGFIWKTCEWEDEINEECVAKNASFYNNIATGSCPTTLNDLPSYFFFENHVRVNPTLLLVVFTSMIIVFLGLMLFKKIKWFLCIINGFIFATILCPVLFATHFYLIRFHGEYTLFRKQEPVVYLRTCLQFISELITQTIPSSYVTYTAKMNKSVKFTSFLDPVLIYLAGVLANLFMQVLISVNLHCFAEIYHFENCTFANLDDLTENKLLFVIVLDVFTKDIDYKHGFVFVYLFIVAYWCLIGVVCSAYSIVETVLDEYIQLKKYKLAFYMGITASIFGATILHYFKIFSLARSVSFLNLKYILILLITIHLALYSTTRFSKDYHFTFGHSINSNSLIIYKLIHILCIFGSIAIIIIYVRELITTGYLKSVISHDFWILFFGIITIVLYGMWAILAKHHDKANSIIMQELEWGPPNPGMKSLRRQFGKNKNVLRQTFACNHHCLQNSEALNKEIKLWHVITKELEQKNENPL